MRKLNPLAEELNSIIETANPAVFAMLSDKGKAIYFPKTGIIGQTAEARGKRINATAGIATEDDGSPVRLSAIAEKVLLDPKDVFSYAPTYGKPELRNKWLEKIKEKNPSLSTLVSLPVVTCALTHGLSLSAFLFVRPGDKIFLTDKFWGNYRLTFEVEAGGELQLFNTFTDGGFDIESFRSALAGGETGKKKIVLLNFPNNPAGYSPTEREAKAIVEIIRERAEAGDRLLVICDDAYFGLDYENDIYPESLFPLLADLHQNVLAVKIDGATKEDYVWGLRVGFLTYGVKGGSEELYRALEAKTAGALRGNVSNVSNLSQSLVMAGLDSSDYKKDKESKFQLIKSRYLKVREILKAEQFKEYLRPLPFNSGYFMCLKVADGLEAERVRKTLLEKYDTGVIAMPGNLLRIAYSSVPCSQLSELFENIYRACEEIKLKMKN